METPGKEPANDRPAPPGRQSFVPAHDDRPVGASYGMTATYQGLTTLAIDDRRFAAEYVTSPQAGAHDKKSISPRRGEHRCQSPIFGHARWPKIIVEIRPRPVIGRSGHNRYQPSARKGRERGDEPRGEGGGWKERQGAAFPLIDDCRLLCLRVIRVSVVNSVWQTLLEKAQTR